MAATLSLFRTSDLRSRKQAPAVSEPQLFYDPPYATREEDAFAWALVRALSAHCGLRHQVEIDGTVFSFVIEMEGRIAAIDIVDGSAMEMEAPVAAPGVDVFYRFTRDDIRDRSHDCLFVMALLDPAFFDPCSRVRARRESSETLAIELNGDRMSEIALRYEATEPLVEIEGEWVVLDPDATAYETRIIRAENRRR